MSDSSPKVEAHTFFLEVVGQQLGYFCDDLDESRFAGVDDCLDGLFVVEFEDQLE